MSEMKSDSREQGMEKYFFRASAADFKKIPGNPISYWITKEMRGLFEKGENYESKFHIKAGISTGKNESFIFLWPEVSFNKIKSGHSDAFAYTPHNKGGEFRKWMGNCDYVLKYSNESIAEMEKNLGFRHDGREFYFQEHVGWSKITSWKSSFRHYPKGFSFDSAGLAIFAENKNDLDDAIAFLNSKPSSEILALLNPTLNVTPQILKSLPFVEGNSNSRGVQQSLVKLTKQDWDSYETSWDFTNLPLLHLNHRQLSLKASYQSLRTHWRETTLEMQRLEEENNRIFIDAYGLQDELTPEVPLKEITLTCNPHYRYGGDKTEGELEALLLADTMRELVSYAVGCMFGRYSPDKPGLILANQGDSLADYLAQVPQPRFAPDDDNVIPLLDGDWFADDITLRFRQFLRVAFGDAHYEDNLAFIEQALNLKGKRNYSLRDYFLGEFYSDHVKRYKKRPIYWLFSSPKGSFNALIYLHRYRPDTVSVVLRYLRDYREKLTTERERQLAVSIHPASSQGEKTKAVKEAERLAKVLAELADYERDTLYPLATEQVQIDLDDGVKVNYLKLRAALKKIPGLEAKDEE